MKKVIITMLAITVFLTGCASIVGQSVFPVTINSNPLGASITIKDEKGMDIFVGTTPTTVTLAAGESYFHAKVYDLTFSKPGYSQQHSQLRAEISGWYFANLLIGGVIGMLIIDPITGKMWKLPKSAYANLSKKTALNHNQAVLQIVALDQIPQEMRKNLIRIN